MKPEDLARAAGWHGDWGSALRLIRSHPALTITTMARAFGEGRDARAASKPCQCPECRQKED